MVFDPAEYLRVSGVRGGGGGGGIFHFLYFRGVNPAAICGGVVCDYFFRIVKVSIVPAAIAAFMFSTDLALTKTLIAELTFSICAFPRISAISLTDRLTNAANFRVVDFD